MCVAYSRPKNLGSIFTYRKIDRLDGPPVSSYLEYRLGGLFFFNSIREREKEKDERERVWGERVREREVEIERERERERVRERRESKLEGEFPYVTSLFSPKICSFLRDFLS